MLAVLRSKITWTLTALALLLGLYAALGFYAAPRLLRSQAIEHVRETYGRDLTLGEVRIHPFKLQAELRDLSLPDGDGKSMIAFRRMFVDFEALASLWHRSFVFREVTLDAPSVRAVIRRDGSVNLAELARPDDREDGEAAGALPTPASTAKRSRRRVMRGPWRPRLRRCRAIAVAATIRRRPLLRSSRWNPSASWPCCSACIATWRGPSPNRRRRRSYQAICRARSVARSSCRRRSTGWRPNRASALCRCLGSSSGLVSSAARPSRPRCSRTPAWPPNASS